MKVKAINRSEEACTRERSQDLRKVSAASGLCIAARAQLCVIPELSCLPSVCHLHYGPARRTRRRQKKSWRHDRAACKH